MHPFPSAPGRGNAEAASGDRPAQDRSRCRTVGRPGAATLVDMLTGTQSPAVRLGASAKEVLTEVGNILLNACLGIFGDILKVHFSFTVPRLHLEALGHLLDSLVIGKEGLHFALLVGAKFRLQDSEVTGCLVIVLGVASLDQLIKAIEVWADSATSSSGQRDQKLK